VSKPPKVEFRSIDPLQDYYCDHKGDFYSVARLVDETKKLKAFDVPIASIDLSGIIWNGLTIFQIAFHCHKVKKADLSKPIILDWNGAIADGRHRIIKALIEGKRTIKAVRMHWTIEPDKRAESE
jgi:hypothetical protein